MFVEFFIDLTFNLSLFPSHKIYEHQTIKCEIGCKTELSVRHENLLLGVEY